MSQRSVFRPVCERLEDRCVPATFTVRNLNDAGANSLRQAILDANLTAAADTIVFKKGLEGTILLTSGQIDITENLTVTGPGSARIAVSGNFSSQIFNIAGGLVGADLTVKLSGLELRHGQPAGGSGGAILSEENLKLTKMVCTLNQASIGGAILCFGDLTVAKSTISGNTAASNSGGGIFCNGTSTITGSTISGNTALNGGGIVSNGTLMITGSKIIGNAASTAGGGILCSNATISGSTLAGNTASQGGAIRCSNATISGSTLTGNTSSSIGGGIHCTGTATITGSTISGNTAATFGGGIYAGTATITGSTISGNTAVSNRGGGLTCATANITTSTIAGNSAGADGGGISCGAATITGSTISGNTAVGGGGGIYLFSAAASSIRNTTISGNRAGADGGGIFTGTSTLSVRNSTIAFNQAVGAGGGMAISGSDPVLESCLIADNTAGAGGRNLASLNVGDIFHLDRCLISLFADPDAELQDLGTNPITTGSPGNNLFNVDARLAPLANNGGKTQTHALKKGSPAINAGSNPAPAEPFDQRGPGFLRKLGLAVDIGAFERQ